MKKKLRDEVYSIALKHMHLRGVNTWDVLAKG